ncbi:MAG: efflux RND transporter periplasmic adaptor subunit [Candidatus Portnoybacteria bacterium]|nr:efflux RND transporter periplasmic adaptor subunit [Candidatus Portnoybacteria bacterium]
MRTTLKIVLFVVILIIILGGGYLLFFREKKVAYDLIETKRGDVVQVVSVTGQIKPAESIELAFDRSAKISQISVAVGDKVKTAQIIATLDNSEIKAQLTQAQAALQSQQAKLEEMKKGTRPEEIAVIEASVTNAQRSLVDAQVNLKNVEDKAEADIRSAYDGALTTAAQSVTVAINSLFVLTDIQFTRFLGYDQDGTKLASAKGNAVLSLLGAANYDRATKDAINALNGGTKASIATAQANTSFENTDKALIDMVDSLKKTKTALDTVPVSTSLTSTELTNLNIEKSNINTEIITIAAKQQLIAVQKTTNNSAIATAEASITTAKNILASAEANLALKKAGYTPEQIEQQEALVKQAQASLMQTEANYDKTILRAPIDGTIKAVEKKRGETAQANATIISMIDSGNFQIEANVSETEIAKIKIGDEVEITFDALGPNEKFIGAIAQIDPAETVVSGVIYYKITITFHENERIKSGMTANLDILTAKEKNTLYLPYYVVKEKNGEKYVQIMDNDEIKEKIIKTGLEEKTTIEITGGLLEGEQVVVEK